MAKKVKEIIFSRSYLKAFSKLSINVRKLVLKKERGFRENCFDSKLKTHKLSGSLEGYYAYSVNYKYRVLFRFINKETVFFIDIDTHDIYKKK